MPHNKYIVILFLFYSQFCFAQNLVQDSSFENSSGQFSSQGWYSWAGGVQSQQPSWFPINTMIFLNGGWYAIQDAPIGGGIWSLQLWGIGNGGDWADATYFITGQQGTAVYTLSVWAKKISGTPSKGPSNICLQKSPVTDFNDYINIGDTIDNKTLYLDTLQQWKKYVLTDTITTMPTDTIYVQLFGVGHLVNDQKYRFDLVQLTAIFLTSTQNTLHLQPEDIKIYPNPFTETATLRITNEKTTNYELKIFDIYGKEMKADVIRNSDSFVIRRSGLSAGMYFYQLSNYNNRELLRQGKLVVQTKP